MSFAWINKHLLIIIVITFVIRFIPGIIFYGTGDVTTAKKQSLQLIAGQNIYQTSTYNYYPDIIFFLYINVVLNQSLGIPYNISTKFPTILADVGIVVLIYFCCKKLYKEKYALIAAYLFALNPLSILISGFHGQYDSLVIFCMLLALFLFEKYPYKKIKNSIILAILIGITLKIWGGMIAPILFLRLKTNNDRLYFVSILAISLAVITIVCLPFFGIVFVQKVFLYKPPPDFGIGAFFEHFPSFFERGPMVTVKNLLLFQNSIVLRLITGISMIISLWVGRKGNMYQAVVILILSIYTFSFGMGAQYFTWVIPFAIIAKDRFVLLYSSVATIAIVSFYLDRYKSAFEPVIFQSFFHISPIPISYGKMIIVLWIVIAIWYFVNLKKLWFKSQ